MSRAQGIIARLDEIVDLAAAGAAGYHRQKGQGAEKVKAATTKKKVGKVAAGLAAPLHYAAYAGGKALARRKMRKEAEKGK